MRRMHLAEPGTPDMFDAQSTTDLAPPGSMAVQPSVAAAWARIHAVRPAAYARTRNALGGAVSGLSPYLTHGFVSLREVLQAVNERGPLEVMHKWVYELGWRAYFRHVWRHRGEGILESLHEGLLPDSAYERRVPDDVRAAATGVPVVDQAVRTLYATGLLHNHARMWLASYLVHQRKVHWRAGADWLYGHLLDGDLASNHLSWQWVAATGSRKPYLFNAENVARYAPSSWHSPGTVVDASYEALERTARSRGEPVAPGQRGAAAPALGHEPVHPPALRDRPPERLRATAPDPSVVHGREVWLVHPWSLGPLPEDLPDDTVVIGLCIADFHRRWPWSEARWHFVGQRMAELALSTWFGEAEAIGAALRGARRVRAQAEPHVDVWLRPWADLAQPLALFPDVGTRCDSFSKWWTQVTRGTVTADELLNRQGGPA